MAVGVLSWFCYIENTRWVSFDIKFTRQGFENACWHREACWDIGNTRWVSFDIKFTRQGFENACWHREACRAIQHAFSKPSLVNLISKDANLEFYLSVYPLLNTLQSDYDVILMFVLIQRHKRRHSKSATSSWPDKGNMPWDRKSLLGHVETIQLILGVTDKWFYYVSFSQVSYCAYVKITALHVPLLWWLYLLCSYVVINNSRIQGEDLVPVKCIWASPLA